MIQEEKSLLLQDLCARLPYGVKCKWKHEYDGKTYTGGGVLRDIDYVKTLSGYRYWDCYFEDEGEDIPIELVKPYLRPMSSMTLEDFQELHSICPHSTFNKTNVSDWIIGISGSDYGRISRIDEISKLIDWLNAHHFDYRGLIPKGLALEAPADIYKINCI